MVTFRVFGAVQDWNTFYCELLTKKIADKLNDGSSVTLSATVEIDYWLQIDELVGDGFPSLMHHTRTNLVLRDNEIVGDIDALIKLAKDYYQIDDAEVANTIVFNRMVRESTYEAFHRFSNPLLSIQFIETSDGRASETVDLGSVIIELFADRCPKACENFRLLCEGCRDVASNKLLKYQNTPVNRIVKNGWVQTGDVIDGTGRNSLSILDELGRFGDESFSVDFSFPRGGVFGYANEGAHSNRSQFFITLGPCAWMNNKFVGFARVVQGFAVLRKLNAQPTSNQVPVKTVKIGVCAPPTELMAPTK